MKVETGATPVPATKSLEAILQDDHDHLDQLWDKATDLQGQDLPQALLLLGEFASGLEEHIGIEEEILFPYALGWKGEAYARLVEVMRNEHMEILVQVGQIKVALKAGRMPSEEVGEALRNVLGDHNAREEGMFYPLFDRAFTEGEGREILERVLGQCSCADH